MKRKGKRGRLTDEKEKVGEKKEKKKTDNEERRQ
jgi:hypothetical protein